MKKYILPMVVLLMSNTSLTYANPLKEESEGLFRRLVVSRKIPPKKEVVSKNEELSVTAEERERYRTYLTERGALNNKYKKVTPGEDSMGEDKFIEELNALERSYADVIQKANTHPGIFEKKIEEEKTTPSSSTTEVKKEPFDYVKTRQRFKDEMDAGDIADEIYDNQVRELNKNLVEILGEQGISYLQERDSLESKRKDNNIDEESYQGELKKLDEGLTKSLEEKSSSSKTEEVPEEKNEKEVIPTEARNEKPELISQEEEMQMCETELNAACITFTNAILMTNLNNTDFKDPNAKYPVGNSKLGTMKVLGKPSFCLNVGGKRRKADPTTGSFIGYTVKNFSVKQSESNNSFYGDYDKNPKSYTINNITADMSNGKDSCAVNSTFCGIEVKFDLEFSFNILDKVTNELKFKNAYGKTIEVSL